MVVGLELQVVEPGGVVGGGRQQGAVEQREQVAAHRPELAAVQCCRVDVSTDHLHSTTARPTIRAAPESQIQRPVHGRVL